jgi:antitoxin component YwqK of YwqJK toxin-antitoxin module
MNSVKSGIPQNAIEKLVAENKTNLSQGHRVVDCFVAANHVGRRVYNQDGILIVETPMKAGLKHGREITWDDEANLLSIEPYRNGKIHGTAKQYGRNGKIIGIYKLQHGTGLDIWRQEDENNKVFVSEIHSLQDGVPNGYEWWFTSSRRDLMHERHWQRGKLHGIERVWNRKGKLRRGYPKFFIEDQVVSKRKYVAMALLDKTLPIFQEKDNLPARKLPAEVRKIMRA